MWIAILIFTGPKNSQSKKNNDNKNNNNKNKHVPSVDLLNSVNLSASAQRFIEEQDFNGNYEKVKSTVTVVAPPVIYRQQEKSVSIFKKSAPSVEQSNLPYDFFKNLKYTPPSEDWDDYMPPVQAPQKDVSFNTSLRDRQDLLDAVDGISKLPMMVPQEACDMHIEPLRPYGDILVPPQGAVFSTDLHGTRVPYQLDPDDLICAHNNRIEKLIYFYNSCSDQLLEGLAFSRPLTQHLYKLSYVAAAELLYASTTAIDDQYRIARIEKHLNDIEEAYMTLDQGFEPALDLLNEYFIVEPFQIPEVKLQSFDTSFHPRLMRIDEELTVVDDALEQMDVRRALPNVPSSVLISDSTLRERAFGSVDKFISDTVGSSRSNLAFDNFGFQKIVLSYNEKYVFNENADTEVFLSISPNDKVVEFSSHYHVSDICFFRTPETRWLVDRMLSISGDCFSPPPILQENVRGLRVGGYDLSYLTVFMPHMFHIQGHYDVVVNLDELELRSSHFNLPCDFDNPLAVLDLAVVCGFTNLSKYGVCVIITALKSIRMGASIDVVCQFIGDAFSAAHCTLNEHRTALSLLADLQSPGMEPFGNFDVDGDGMPQFKNIFRMLRSTTLCAFNIHHMIRLAGGSKNCKSQIVANIIAWLMSLVDFITELDGPKQYLELMYERMCDVLSEKAISLFTSMFGQFLSLDEIPGINDEPDVSRLEEILTAHHVNRDKEMFVDEIKGRIGVMKEDLSLDEYTEYMAFRTTSIIPKSQIVKDILLLEDCINTESNDLVVLSMESQAGTLLDGVSEIMGFIAVDTIVTDLKLIPQSMQWLRRYLSFKDNGQGFFKCIVSFFHRLVNTLKECVLQGSFAPLLGKSFDFEEWLDKARILRNPALLFNGDRKTFAKLQLEPHFPKEISHQISPALLIPMLVEHISIGKSIRKNAAVQSVGQFTIPFVLEEVKQLTSLLNVKQHVLKAGSRRVQPLGVLLEGKPGIGKSHLVADLAKIACNAFNVDYSPSYTYYRKKENFWTGAGSHTMVCVFDDPDQNPAKPAYGDRTFISDIFDVVNDQPFFPEQAAVEDKGKEVMLPVCTIWTTNTLPSVETLSPFVKQPTAVTRRFPHVVRMVARPEHCDHLGVVIEDKIDDTTWEYHVGFLDPVNYQFQLVNKYASRRQFLSWFRNRMELENKKWDKLHAHEDNAIHSPCPVCKLPISSHIGDGCSQALKKRQEVLAEKDYNEWLLTYDADQLSIGSKLSLAFRRTNSDYIQLSKVFNPENNLFEKRYWSEFFERKLALLPAIPVAVLDEWRKRGDSNVVLNTITFPILYKMFTKMNEVSRMSGNILIADPSVQFRWEDLEMYFNFEPNVEAQSNITAFSSSPKSFSFVTYPIFVTPFVYYSFCHAPYLFVFLISFLVFSTMLYFAVVIKDKLLDFIIGKFPQEGSWARTILEYYMFASVMSGSMMVHSVNKAFKRKNVLAVSNLSLLVASLVAVLAAGVLYRYFSTNDEKKKDKDPNVEILPDNYEKTLSKDQVSKASTQSVTLEEPYVEPIVCLASNWDPIKRQPKVNLNPHPPETIIKIALQNHAILRRKKKDGKYRTVCGYRYDGAKFVFPSHVFHDYEHIKRYWEPPEDMEAECVITCGSTITKKITSREIIKVPNVDLCILHLAELPSVGNGISSFLYPSQIPESIKFDSKLLIRRETETLLASGISVVAKVVAGETMILSPQRTLEGDCGALLIGQIGSGWFIVGMHVALLSKKDSAQELLRKEYFVDTKLQSGVLNSDDSFVACSGLMFKKDKNPISANPSVLSDIQVQDVERSKSTMKNYHLSRKNSVVPEFLGHIVGAHTTSFKSKILPTPWKDKIVAIAASNGITIDHVAPVYRIVKPTSPDAYDEFKSPEMVNLTAMRNLFGKHHEMEFAVDDFTYPFKEMWDRPEMNKVYRRLTHAEVLHGTPLLNPLQLGTSAGPPFSGPKMHTIVSRRDDETLMVNPGFMANVNEARVMLEGDGPIPIFPYTSTLKDEVISLEKQNDLKIRVFNNGSSVQLYLLREEFGWLAEEIQSHRYLFESLIGFNAYDPLSVEGSKKFFEAFGSGLNAAAGDYRWYDVRNGTLGMSYGCEVIHRLSQHAGAHTARLYYIRRLLVSVIYTIRLMKGDAGLFAATNASGGFLTAILNGIMNSLYFRCAYYRLHTSPQSVPSPVSLIAIPPFRENVKLGTMGDDNLRTVNLNYPLMSRFTNTFVGEVLSDYGHEYTSADKESELEDTFISLSDCSILKRSYFDCDESPTGVFLKLELKSIYKMICFTGDTSTSRLEAAIQTLYSARNELVMYGRKDFERLWPSIADATEHVLMDESYDVLLARLLKADVTYRPHPVEVVIDTAVVQSATGNLDLPIMTDTHTNSVEAPVLARPPEEQIDQFWLRKQRVHTWVVSSADVANSVVTVDFPVSEYITNPVVQSKLAGYGLWRGTLEVTVVYTGTATQYGTYLVCTQPMADEALTSNLADYRNVWQMNPIFINPSVMSSYSFKIPFLSPYNYAPTDLEPGLPEWITSVICISPLKDVSGTPTTGTLTFYVNACPDFTLGSLRLQGLSSMLSSASDAAGMVSGVLAGASKIASMLGLTRSLDTKPTVPMLMRAVPELNGAEGSESTSSTTGFIHNNFVESRNFGCSDEDDQLFSTIFKREGLVKIKTWTTGDIRNTVLSCIPVTPMLNFKDGLKIQPTPTSYIGQPFAYWNGVMKFKVRTDASRFHGGSIALFWSPIPINQGTVLTSDPIGSTNYCRFDIVNGAENQVSVGWNVYNNCLATNYASADDYTAANFEEDGVNGYLIMVVVSPIVLGGQATTTVTITITSSSDELYFGVPKVFVGTINSTQCWHGAFIPQGLEDTAPSTTLCSLGTAPVPEILGLNWGATLLSVKAMAQMYSPSTGGGARVTWLNTANTFYLFTFSNPFYGDRFRNTVGVTVQSLTSFTSPTAVYGGLDSQFTWTNWVQNMYLGIRGSVYIKIIPVAAGNSDDVMNAIGAVGYLGSRRPAALTASVVSGSTSGFFCDRDSVVNAPTKDTILGPVATVPIIAEYHVPYDSNKNFHLCNTGGIDGTQGKWIYIRLVNFATAGYTRFYYMHSCGPDVQLIRFLNVPQFDEDYYPDPMAALRQVNQDEFESFNPMSLLEEEETFVNNLSSGDNTVSEAG